MLHCGRYDVISPFNDVILAHDIFMTVNATCSITFPQAQFKSQTKLSWSINGEAAPLEYVSSIRGRRILSSLQSSPAAYYAKYQADEETSSSESSGSTTALNSVMASMIRFLVNPKHFTSEGVMRLRCTASTTPAAYARSSEEITYAEPVRGASSNPGRYSSKASGTLKSRSWLFPPLTRSFPSQAANDNRMIDNRLFFFFMSLHRFQHQFHSAQQDSTGQFFLPNQ